MNKIFLTLSFLAVISRGTCNNTPELIDDSSKDVQIRRPVPNKIYDGIPIEPVNFVGALIYYQNNKYLGEFCTASLITPNRVLTAAHCFMPDLVSPGVRMQFVWGLSDLSPQSILASSNNPNVTMIDFTGDDVEIHDDYSAKDLTFFNDIAIVRLKTPVTTKGARPIKLADREYYTDLYDVGWGFTNCTHQSLETLRIATAILLRQEDCDIIWRWERKGVPIYDSQLCAYFVAGDQPSTTAPGDSGGPLFYSREDPVVEAPQNPVQVGIVSHGYHLNYNSDLGWKCVHLSYPSVFTRVSAYKRWILEFAPEVEFV